MLPTAPTTRNHKPFAPPPWHDDHPQRLRLGDRLPPDHLARRIDRLVDALDLTELYRAYPGTGSPPLPPDLLLKVVLYETHSGHHAPADWHRHAHDCEPVRWLARGLEPARCRWYAFRDRLAPLLDGLNRQVLRLAQDLRLTPGTRGALDGSAVAARASRRRLLNEATLGQRLAQLEQACAADGQGEAPAARPYWMAKTARGRAGQLGRYRQAQGRMAQAQQRNRQKRASKRKAADKVVVSPSEPEAALGLDKEKVYRPLYNVQYVDDLDSPLVLAYEVFAQPNDAGTLGPMLGRAEALLGRPLEVALADAGYAGGADLAAAQAAQVTVYAPWQANGASGRKRAGQAPRQLPKESFRWLPEEGRYECPQGHPLELVGAKRDKRSGVEAVVQYQYRCDPEHCRACPLRGSCTPNPSAGRTVTRGEHEGLIEGLRARMATAEAKALYRLRRQTVELGFADLKEHRKLRRFAGWGRARARAQVGLVVLAHNGLEVLRAREAAQGDTSHTITPEETST